MTKQLTNKGIHPLFEQYQQLWEILFWLSLALFNSVTNSLSVLSDYHRQNIEIAQWQPVLWESSSQLAIIMLIPLIVLWDRKYPLSLAKIKLSLLNVLLCSIAFSILHVSLMVLMRKAGYWLADDHYTFGNWANELLYEYRKDLGDYLSIITTIYVYRFIVSRLRSEATPIEEGENQPDEPPAFVQRFIVKKLGKEFTVNAADIEWVEAAGNYMNLHIEQRSYPIRETMSGLTARLDPRQFARIHRSYIVNLDQVTQIEPQSTGDFKLALKNGKTLKLSRRYRESLKAVYD